MHQRKWLGIELTPQEDKTEIPAEIVPVIVGIHIKKLLEIEVESVSEFFHVVPMDSPDQYDGFTVAMHVLFLSDR